MGSFSSILKMIPGMNKLGDIKVDDKEFDKIEAMINSMSAEERANPKILNGSRRKRISKGSGTTIFDVNQLLKQFEQMQKVFKKFGGKKGLFKKIPFSKFS
jgi:signal recognition particle subunit SRP54